MFYKTLTKFTFCDTMKAFPENVFKQHILRKLQYIN